MRSKTTNNNKKRKENFNMKNKKARYSEVPKEYRRNYKKELLNICGMLLTALLFDVFALFIFFAAIA